MQSYIRSFLPCLFALLVPAVSSAEIPDAPVYGPARNAYIHWNHAFQLGVPVGQTVTITVRTSAFNENACFVYDDAGKTVLKRGNYSWQANPNTFTFANSTGQKKTFVIAAWHKNSPPTGGQPWYASQMKTFQSDRTKGMFGFEDLILAGNQTKYNDVIVEYRLDPVPVVKTLGKRKKK